MQASNIPHIFRFALPGASGQWLAAAVLALLCAAVSPCISAAQETWVYSPYEIQVWLVLEDSPLLTPRLEQQIRRTLTDRANIDVGAAFTIHINTEPAEIPAAIQSNMLHDLEEITVEPMQAASAELFHAYDKVMLLAVNASPQGFSISARELDPRSNSLGPVFRHTTRQRGMVPALCFSSLMQAFSPIARIEDSYTITHETGEGENLKKSYEYRARLTIRAGGLILNENSPALPVIGSVMKPVIRKAGRFGKKVNLVQVDWTYLVIRNRFEWMLDAEVFSGFRNPLAGRAGRRTLRLGVSVKPVYESTTLQVVSKAKEPRPLEGYELYAKDINTGDSQLVGQTDWRGSIKIPPGSTPLRLLFVKNGGRLLARLPVAPGYLATETAQVPDDELRLQAEAVMKGLQSRVMDVVAKRQVLASRVRRSIKLGKFEDASKLIEGYRRFETLGDLQNALNQARQDFKTTDIRQKSRIDSMFSETNTLLYKFLDNQIESTLRKELAAAGGQ